MEGKSLTDTAVKEMGVTSKIRTKKKLWNEFYDTQTPQPQASFKQTLLRQLPFHFLITNCPAKGPPSDPWSTVWKLHLGAHRCQLGKGAPPQLGGGCRSRAWLKVPHIVCQHPSPNPGDPSMLDCLQLVQAIQIRREVISPLPQLPGRASASGQFNLWRCGTTWL